MMNIAKGLIAIMIHQNSVVHLPIWPFTRAKRVDLMHLHEVNPFSTSKGPYRKMNTEFRWIMITIKPFAIFVTFRVSIIVITTDFKGKSLVSENGLSKRHETRTALVISYTSL